MSTRRVQRTINLPPKVKARPRLGRRGRVFTPQATVDAEHTIAAAFAGVEPFNGPVKVTIDYWKHKQRIAVCNASGAPLRGDLDNYVKLTLDGLQRPSGADGEVPAVIPNDRQVIAITARIHT